MSVKQKIFLEFFTLVCSLKACFKNSSDLFLFTYNAIYFSCFLIQIFSKKNNILIELKFEEYKNNRAKITSVVSHIFINSTF